MPAEFRPLGSEDDAVCTWHLKMVHTKKHAGILGSGSYGTAFPSCCRGYFSVFYSYFHVSSRNLYATPECRAVLLVMRRLLGLDSDFEQTGESATTSAMCSIHRNKIEIKNQCSWNLVSAACINHRLHSSGFHGL